MTKRNSNQIAVMSAGAIIGGVLGGLLGIWWLNPGILIPIGVVVGLAIGMAVGKR